MLDPKALRHFLDTLPDAVIVLDRSARIYHANAAAQHWVDAVAGATLPALQPQLGGSLVHAVQQVLTKGVPRLHAAAPALPDRITLASGEQCKVSLTPLESERWALRLERVPSAAAHPPHDPSAAALSSLSGEVMHLFWESPFPACVQDGDHRFIQVNQAFADFTGRPADKLIGLDPIELQPEEDRELTLAYRLQARALSQPGQPSGLVERRIVHADGRERWYRATWRKWADEQGRTCYLSILQDNTAEHAARERADRSARELDDWFDLSPVGMVLFDEQGLLVRTNPAFESLVGEVPVLMPDAEPGVQQLLCWNEGRPHASLQPGASPLEAQASVAQPDGSVRSLRSALRCYRTATGQLRYMAVVEDRSAEEERDLAQMQIGALMDTAGVGLATFQESEGWVQHGNVLPSPSGGDGSATAALRSIRREVVLPESMPEYERLQQALRHGQRTEVRYAIRHPDLGQRWLQTRVEPATLASGKRTTSVVTLDITEQQQAAVRSDTLLREMTTILESATAGMAYLRSGVLVRCNRRFEALLGVHDGKVVGCSLAELFASQPDAVRLVRDIEAALAADTVFEDELAFQSAAQGTQWCSLAVRRAGPLGDVSEAIVVLSDITRLKLQQKELEAVARDRELMFSLSEVGIAFIRGDRVQRANDAMCRLTRHESDAMDGLPISALFASEEEYRRLQTIMQASMARHGRWLGERQLKRRDGSLVWVQVSTRQINDANPEEGLIASYVNVDDRHRAQQAVGLQAERTRAILDSVLVGIVTVGPGGIEWMNRSARRMFGGDLADFIGQPISIGAPNGEAEHPFLQTHYLNELIEGQAETFECKVKALDGREFWVVGNAVVTGRESTGRQLTYALLDIERRRQAEARTAEVQASLQRVIEAAPLAITLFDADTLRIVQANQTAAQSMGMGADQLIGRSPEDLFEPALAARYRADMTQALTAHAVTQREYRAKTAGDERLWDARYLPMSAAGAPADQLLMVATDVTEQRAAQEARFEAAIAQREMLVKEVHHRIKNNLQGVAGLLQQIGARKPEVAPFIGEVVGQVQAIAQVYGLQVGVTGPLRVKNVLEAITGSVQRTFGRPIRLTVDGPAHLWALPEAESIPIALTVNELLTNAVKHSNAVADPSAVHCSLRCSDAEVHIGVANRGQLPAGFNLARYPGGVSGLGLVRALLPRRSASLDLEQQGDDVVATVTLVPPGVSRIAAA